jgi:hypothetical protein
VPLLKTAGERCGGERHGQPLFCLATLSSRRPLPLRVLDHLCARDCSRQKTLEPAASEGCPFSVRQVYARIFVEGKCVVRDTTRARPGASVSPGACHNLIQIAGMGTQEEQALDARPRSDRPDWGARKGPLSGQVARGSRRCMKQPPDQRHPRSTPGAHCVRDRTD